MFTLLIKDAGTPSVPALVQPKLSRLLGCVQKIALTIISHGRNKLDGRHTVAAPLTLPEI
jgi:hypothetical protein